MFIYTSSHREAAYKCPHCKTLDYDIKEKLLNLRGVMENFDKILEGFEGARDEVYAGWISAYMRNKFRFFGIPMPKRRLLYRSILSAAKRSKVIDWVLLDRCWENEYRDFQYFVFDYLMAMQPFLTYEDVINHLEKYVRSKQWWDSIDNLDGIIGNIAFTDCRINELMLKWSTDDDFWVRRIAIDHQLNRKEKTDTALLKQILLNNFGSKEFFINKAIGWSLRDYSKTDPNWVRQFVEKYKDQMNPLSIREASKYI